jgi:predicted RNA polymerase sigma factor
MLLHDSRQVARVTESGDLMPLEEQDRRLLNAERIAEESA